MNTHSIIHRHFVAALLFGLSLAASANAQDSPKAKSAAVFDVRDFGAKGDGTTFDTPAVQAGIDAAAVSGGTVLVHGGTFLCRTLILKSNVTLCVDAGAVLMGTPTLEDYAEIKPAYVTYTYSHRAFLYAGGAENVSIVGKGAIDLQGRAFPPQPKPGTFKITPAAMEWGQSPFAVRLVKCRNLTVRDITIRNCPMTALRIVGGERVLVDGVVIENRVRIGCDGIEIVSSSYVYVSHCRVDSWDDGICLKSSSPDPCRNIAITNCTISSLCNAIKMGTESSGGFENIAISNCVIDGGEMDGWRSLNGLALEIVDGGTMNGIGISNIVMRGVRTALFIRLANRARLFSPDTPKPGVGVLKNVSISHVQDLELTDFTAKASTGPLIRLRDTRDALIQNSRPRGDVEAFLQIEGGPSANIALLANDLRRARKSAVTLNGAAAVSETSNLHSTP